MCSRKVTILLHIFVYDKLLQEGDNWFYGLGEAAREKQRKQFLKSLGEVGEV